MILYNVTVSVDPEVHDAWVGWMRDIHIPEVMQTGKFTEHKWFRILGEEEGMFTYSIQYFASDMEQYRAYAENHAPALQADAKKRFGDRFVAFRTLLESV